MKCAVNFDAVINVEECKELPQGKTMDALLEALEFVGLGPDLPDVPHGPDNGGLFESSSR